VLNEFVCDPSGTPNSAPIALSKTPSLLFASKVAKNRGLNIDTTVAWIRATAQDRGIGVLTLAGLSFAAIKEADAAARHDAFLDDGNIFNFTADSHPIHLHLVQYQVLEKWHIDFLDQNDDSIPDDTNGDGLITYGYRIIPQLFRRGHLDRRQGRSAT
jgi:hypothetical protein